MEAAWQEGAKRDAEWRWATARGERHTAAEERRELGTPAERCTEDASFATALHIIGRLVKLECI